MSDGIGFKIGKMLIAVGMVEGVLVGVELPHVDSKSIVIDVFIGIIRFHFSYGVDYYEFSRKDSSGDT